MQNKTREKNTNYKKGKFVMKWILIGLFALIVIYVGVQGIRARHGLGEAKMRLAAYDEKTASLSYGKLTYLD